MLRLLSVPVKAPIIFCAQRCAGGHDKFSTFFCKSLFYVRNVFDFSKMYTQQDLFFSTALAVYIAVGVVVAIVRWGHRCEPYSKNMDYYYPAWRTVVFCFLTNLMLLPFVYMPHDTDSDLALRIILMLGSPYFCAMFMFTYFGRMLKRKSWIMPLIFLSVPFTVMTLLALAIAIEPGQQLVGRDARILVSISGTLAFIFLYAFGSALYMIGQARRRFSETNFSNPDDFPKDFARQAVCMAGWHVVITGVQYAHGMGPVCPVRYPGVLPYHRPAAAPRAGCKPPGGRRNGSYAGRDRSPPDFRNL